MVRGELESAKYRILLWGWWKSGRTVVIIACIQSHIPKNLSLSGLKWLWIMKQESRTGILIQVSSSQKFILFFTMCICYGLNWVLPQFICEVLIPNISECVFGNWARGVRNGLEDRARKLPSASQGQRLLETQNLLTPRSWLPAPKTVRK